MVYGKGCKGNYTKLSSLAVKTPLFPKYNNKRSMIYIDNLSEFIKQVINNKSTGLFFPQNSEYVNTSEMVKKIAEFRGKKLILTKLFNPVLKLLKVGIVNKIFGDLVYNQNLSGFESNYIVVSFDDSIKNTEMEK
ncbi:hypothetical protein [Alkalibacterium olivapovliticus]|uniref:Uncharacterized protein n=1 Tax=Alkalibacterium olivapovliticus TaxID=99907 RepID=A0A2T0W7J0_9LACT|nr:hypothetical protein CLV38_1099 [Alkalibacterium olivapovliticus]